MQIQSTKKKTTFIKIKWEPIQNIAIFRGQGIGPEQLYTKRKKEYLPGRRIHCCCHRQKTLPVQKIKKVYCFGSLRKEFYFFQGHYRSENNGSLLCSWNVLSRKTFRLLLCRHSDQNIYLVTGVRAVGRPWAILKGKHRPAVFCRPDEYLNTSVSSSHFTPFLPILS